MCVFDIEKDPVKIFRGATELQDGGFGYLPCTIYSAAMRCAGCRQALSLIDLCSSFLFSFALCVCVSDIFFSSTSLLIS